MREPYRPKLLIDPTLPLDKKQAIQAAIDKHYDDQGITQELVREPLPMGGGFGFIWKFWRHGVPIPHGIQGL